jgi:hypothetical protein
MSDPFKNLQAAARRRGLSLRREKLSDDGAVEFSMTKIEHLGGSRHVNTHRSAHFEDLGEVRDELRLHPTA